MAPALADSCRIAALDAYAAIASAPNFVNGDFYADDSYHDKVALGAMELFVGMLEENAGFVLPEKAIAAHALLALRHGAELHGQEAVTHWSLD